MALIGKIRQNFWFVLIVLGLALAAFVIMDMQGASRGSSLNPTLGTINGKKINIQEFNQTESVLSQNAGGQNANQRRESIWDYFVSKSIVEGEVEGLGINVPAAELNELQFGQNLSPIIQQSFYNPNTGGIDRQQLAQVQNMVQNNQGMTDQFREYWRVQEYQIMADQLQNKLSNLVSKAVYTPAWQAEQQFKFGNTRAQVAYVKVPFDAISNDQVEVSDSDIKSYINENKSQYTNDKETRIIDFITFPVEATSADSASILEQLTKTTSELRDADSSTDSLFAINNNGSKPTYYYKTDDLPDALKDNIAGLAIGETYGPYLDNGIYSSVKLVDKKVIPDSVEARIIFRQAPVTSPDLVTSANTLLDSLKVLLDNGTQEFDSLAIANSQDGSSARGGDLGYLTQGALPPAMDQILFLSGNRTGKVFKGATDQGVFLLELTELIQRTTDDKYRLAYINAPIVPSDDTQNNALDLVNDFLSDNRVIESMTTVAKEKGYDLRSSQALDINAFNIGTLGADQSSRNIVRWAFDQSTELGDVSPDLYRYQDPVEYYTNKYVVAALREVVPAGVQSVNTLRDDLTPLIRNKMKAAKIVSEITANDLAAVASKYSVSIDTLPAVTMNSAVIPALGSEPNVVSAIFSTSENSVSAPVTGNSGVYLVKPISVAEPGQASNVPSLRTNSMNQNRSKIQFGLLEGLKKTADIDDGRFTYGF